MTNSILKFNIKDALGGLLLIALGLLFMFGALDMPMGTMRRPGAGVFPLGLSVLCIIFGLVIGAQAFRQALEWPEVHWRPAIAVSLAIAVFYVLFRIGGLMPATAGAVIIAAAGDKEFEIVRAALTAVGVAILSWLIFRVGLSLPMPAIRGVF